MTNADAAVSAVDPKLLKNQTSTPWKKISPQQSKYFSFFQDWSKKLEAKLKDSSPKLDVVAARDFRASCTAVQSANQVKQDAEKLCDTIANQKPVNKDEVAAAKKAVEDADKALKDALDTCQKVAVDTILDKGLKHIFGEDFDDADLVTYTVISHGTPKQLAAWCDQDEKKASQLIEALKDTDLMRLFLESGGARNGKYGKAVELYHIIQPSDPVLKRLALAVALELADPYELFDNNKEKTDALQRYVHYEQSYLFGELDPNFSQFNVWELRHVVNSDATEEELSWGRRCLLNYRPDLAISKDPQWRYCMIVKTDVNYTTPDWYKPERSYDQILSGGGKCGPRAWYGRFIARAFGIPVWGIRQPGHAAMTRWTVDGWVVCLGGGMWKSWWEDQGGLDFLLETQARTACGSEKVFLQKVLRLQWISSFHQEKVNVIKCDNLPDPKSPWGSLGMMQRRRLAPQAANKRTVEVSCCKNNKIQQIMLNKEGKYAREPVAREDQTIVIPATTCSSPAKQTKKVLFLPCFMGGQQLYVKEDAEVVYTLSSNIIKTAQKYKLTCRVCTAHRSEKPLLLTVKSASKEEADTVYQIKMPYTMGEWEQTEPIVVELSGQAPLLNFARPKQNFGFSFKDIKLVTL